MPDPLQPKGYIEAKAFAQVLHRLNVTHDFVSVRVLERLEEQRVLVPHLRLRYPDPIERWWFNQNRYGWKTKGKIETNSPRRRAASRLERARLADHSPWAGFDPLEYRHALDRPKPSWKQFIQNPQRRKFVPWDKFRVRVDAEPDGPTYHSETAVTYYSSWQALLFLERESPRWVLKEFGEFRRQLDAATWFVEEDNRNEIFVLRNGSGRRLIEEHERLELERRSELIGNEVRRRFRVTYPQMVRLSQFLARRWGEWDRIGYSHHTAVYKAVLGQALSTARYLKNVSGEKLIEDVGRVTGHTKPTLRVIYGNWLYEWRDDAQRLLESFARPGAILKADFEASEIAEFLGFIEESELYDFLWRWKSINERAFSNDEWRVYGVRSDLQSFSLSVEHLVGALLKPYYEFPKPQLYQQFERIWPISSQVGKLIRSPEFIAMRKQRGDIDLTWFNEKQEGGVETQIAADIVLSHAIRGNAHVPLAASNQLNLERMSLIFLRASMRAYREVRRRWPV